MKASVSSGVRKSIGAGSASAADNGEVEKSILFMGITWNGYVQYLAEDGSWAWSEEIQASTSCTGWFVSTDGDFVSAGHCVDPEMGKDNLIRQYLGSKGAMDLLDDALNTWVVEGFETGAPIDRVVRVAQPADVEGVAVTIPTVVQVMDFQPFKAGDAALLRINGLSKETPALSIAPDHPENGDELGYGPAVPASDDATVPGDSSTSGPVRRDRRDLP